MAQNRTSTELCTQCGHSLSCIMPLGLNWTEIVNITRSGRPPNSDIERSILEQQLQDTQTDIDRFQVELNRLRELTETLETQKQLLLAHRDRIHSIIASPIRTLPRELLVEIFSHLCLPVSATSISTPTKILPMLIISQVCIEWHKLVNDTPILWSSFNIIVGTQSHTPAKCLTMLKLILQKSGSHPIDFTFWSGSMDIFALINTRAISDRWRRVYIVVNSSLREMMFGLSSFGAVSSPPPRDFPELVSLKLHSTEAGYYSLPNCPKLVSLTLYRVHLHHQPSSPCWTSVRKVDLELVTLQNIIHVLESCPNAESVCIRSPSSNEDTFSQQWPTLVCSRTRDLRLILYEDEAEVIRSFAVLLDHLTVPALTYLCLSAYEAEELYDEEEDFSGQYSSLIDSLCSMLHRSHTDASSVRRNLQGTSLTESPSQPAGVTHLSLQRLTLSRVDLLRLFDALPCVRHFDYYEALRGQRSTADQVIKALMVPQAHTPLNEKDGILFGNGVGRGHIHLNEDSEPGDEARNMLGQDCRFPSLRDLTLQIRPRNDLLIQVIESRWRSSLLPDSQEPRQEKENTEQWVCLQRVECIIYQCRLGTIHTEAEDLRLRCQQYCDEGLKLKISTRETGYVRYDDSVDVDSD